MNPWDGDVGHIDIVGGQGASAAGFAAAAAGVAPWLLPIAMTAGSILGGKKGNEASAFQAQRSREFQEYMYAHRHQITKWDMQKAKLNPILAMGSVGSAPGGAMAAQRNPVSGAFDAANVRRRQTEEFKTMKRQRSLMSQQERAASELANKTEHEASTARSVANMTRLDEDVRRGRQPGEMHGAGLHSSWAANRIRELELGGRVINVVNPLNRLLPTRRHSQTAPWGGHGKKKAKVDKRTGEITIPKNLRWNPRKGQWE